MGAASPARHNTFSYSRQNARGLATSASWRPSAAGPNSGRPSFLLYGFRRQTCVQFLKCCRGAEVKFKSEFLPANSTDRAVVCSEDDGSEEEDDDDDDDDEVDGDGMAMEVAMMVVAVTTTQWKEKA